MDPISEKYKTEVFFVSYEEVIKSPYPVILQTILTKYKDFYSNYLKLDDLVHYNFANLTRFCIQRTDVNLLEYIAKTEFDYEGTLLELKSRFSNLYKISELLKFGQSLPILIAQRFTEKVYIYSPKYDPRIHLDIQTSLGTMDKIAYVAGNLAEAVSNLKHKVTAFVFNDIAQIVEVAPTGKLKNSTVLLASYGYNYTLDSKGDLILKIDIEKMCREYGFEFVQFAPIDFTDEHFALE